MKFLTVLLALFCFGVMILLHEGGHFFFARRFGIPVREFAIGMGPRLVSWKSKKYDTVYSLRALPIGGFVSMVGEDEQSEDENAFGRKPVWQRMMVTVAGALVNISVGFLCMFVLLISSGQPLMSTHIGAFAEGAASEASGLQVGDVVLRVDGNRVHTGYELVYAVTHDGQEPIDLVVARDGEEVLLKGVAFPTSTADGVVFGEPDFRLYEVEKTFSRLMYHTFWRSVMSVRMVWDSLVDFARGRYSMEQVSGPVGATEQISEAAEQGAFTFIYLISIISVNLGIVNLLPFPALDGGRLVFLVIELFRRKPMKAEVEAYINFAGIVVLMGFMLLVTCKDIIKLFG